jgi:hypothetical protein
MTFRVVEDPKGEWSVVNDSCPQTDEYYYGLVAHGFDSRDEAERYAKLRNLFPHMRDSWSPRPSRERS